MRGDEIRQPRITVPQKTTNYGAWSINPEDYRCLKTTKEKIQHLLGYFVLAPSSHNTQPWAFKISENDLTLKIFPDWGRHLPVSDPSSRELFISLGAGLANLEVAAQFFGWKMSHKILGDQIKEIFIEVELLPASEPSGEVAKLFEAIKLRVNYDGEHQDRPLPQKLKQDLLELFKRESGIFLNLSVDQKSKQALANLVEQGDKKIFFDLSFIQELIGWILDSASRRKDGIPSWALGMPSTLRRFAPKVLLSGNAKLVDEVAKADRIRLEGSGGIGMIASIRNNPREWIRIGKLYQLAGLMATSQGVFFGARAVLVEAESLHRKAAETGGVKGRLQVMFRVGFPTQETLMHAPRFPATERVVAKVKGEDFVVPTNRPTIFKLDDRYKLNDLLSDLGKVEVEDAVYGEHWLADLFGILHPSGSIQERAFQEKLEQFIRKHDNEFDGVWVYFPETRSVKHIPSEDNFYKIITASNSRKISSQAQKKMKGLKIGICGLSGSGTEAALAAVMSGVTKIKIADFDSISPKNLNRMEGGVGESKITELAWRLWNHNPFLEIDFFAGGLTEENVEEFVEGLDLIIEQSDSSSKFLVRDHGKKRGVTIVQITDMPDPIIDIEMPGTSDFGGRAKRAGINSTSMSGIGSLAESTAYLPVLMDPKKVPSESYENFLDILEGKSNSYSQLYIGAQAGGGAIGRVLVALAENKLDRFPRSYVVRTAPKRNSVINNKSMKKFIAEYKQRFGLDRFKGFYDSFTS